MWWTFGARVGRRSPTRYKKWEINVGVVSYFKAPKPHIAYPPTTMEFKLITTAFVVVMASFVQANPALTLDQTLKLREPQGCGTLCPEGCCGWPAPLCSC